MRLWHNDLISALPRNQLLGQWRELNSIYKLKNRHILINFVYEYPASHLYTYSYWIIQEMKGRNYKINLENHDNYFDEERNKILLDRDDVFPYKMNLRYMLQCYYNLEEKYDCSSITEEEWFKISHSFQQYRDRIKE